MTQVKTQFQAEGPEQVYHDALKMGIFQIQRCDVCDAHVFYPRVFCVHCGSTDLTWIRPSGFGHVYSSTVIRRRAEAGGDLNIALIELQEGVRMMSRVDGIAPDKVSIGMAVQAHIIHENMQPLVIFTAAENQAGELS